MLGLIVTRLSLQWGGAKKVKFMSKTKITFLIIVLALAGIGLVACYLSTPKPLPNNDGSYRSYLAEIPARIITIADSYVREVMLLELFKEVEQRYPQPHYEINVLGIKSLNSSVSRIKGFPLWVVPFDIEFSIRRASAEGGSSSEINVIHRHIEVYVDDRVGWVIPNLTKKVKGREAFSCAQDVAEECSGLFIEFNPIENTSIGQYEYLLKQKHSAIKRGNIWYLPPSEILNIVNYDWILRIEPNYKTRAH